ncbi:hypothetical protein GCM10027172_11830 [Halomonas garicola]
MNPSLDATYAILGVEPPLRPVPGSNCDCPAEKAPKARLTAYRGGEKAAGSSLITLRAPHCQKGANAAGSLAV